MERGKVSKLCPAVFSRFEPSHGPARGGAFSRSGHGRPETLVASAVLGRPLCAVGPVNSGVRVVSLVDLLVMTTRAALRAAFGSVIPGASTHQVWGPGVRGIPASFAPKSLRCGWKGDDASPGGGHDSMRGLPEMRTPIVEEQSIPATEDELAKRRAAALRAWLEGDGHRASRAYRTSGQTRCEDEGASSYAAVFPSLSRHQLKI